MPAGNIGLARDGSGISLFGGRTAAEVRGKPLVYDRMTAEMQAKASVFGRTAAEVRGKAGVRAQLDGRLVQLLLHVHRYRLDEPNAAVLSSPAAH